MLVINRLMVSYDTPRQYLNFNWTDFLLFILVQRHLTFKLRVFHLWQVNLPLTRSPLTVPYGANFCSFSLRFLQFFLGHVKNS